MQTLRLEEIFSDGDKHNREPNSRAQGALEVGGSYFTLRGQTQASLRQRDSETVFWVGDIKKPAVCSVPMHSLGCKGPVLAEEDDGLHLEACVGGRALFAGKDLGISSKCSRKQKLELEESEI